MNELKLERREQRDQTANIGRMSLTPMVDEDYWAYRVRLTDKQAVLGFPKFGTIGIGFAAEEDWNTNLPYRCDTDEICQHIKHNAGDDSITEDDIRAAVELIQQAARDDRDGGR